MKLLSNWYTLQLTSVIDFGKIMGKIYRVKLIR